jgi:hypothetical protein
MVHANHTKQTNDASIPSGGHDVCLFGRIGGAAGPVPQDDCSSPPTINDPERSSMATPSLSDPTTEDIESWVASYLL